MVCISTNMTALYRRHDPSTIRTSSVLLSIATIKKLRRNIQSLPALQRSLHAVGTQPSRRLSRSATPSVPHSDLYT